MLPFLCYILISSSFMIVKEIGREPKERFFEMTYTAEIEDLPRNANY